MAFFKRNPSTRTAPAPEVVEKKGVFGSKKVVTNENDGRMGSNGTTSTGNHLFSGYVAFYLCCAVLGLVEWIGGEVSRA